MIVNALRISKASKLLSSVFFNTLIVEQSSKCGDQKLNQFFLGH